MTTNYRHRIKERAVYVMGGQCQCCGYNKCLRALHFHHINEATKLFQISDNVTRNWADVRTELKKCVLVCSNCHQEIHEGIQECPPSSFNEERAQEIDELVQKNKKQYHYCIECGAQVYQKNSLCMACAGKKRRKTERPNREELKNLIRTTSFLAIGAQFGVSDNAVRKWCQKEGLPYRTKDIKAISDEEWLLI